MGYAVGGHVAWRSDGLGRLTRRIGALPLRLTDAVENSWQDWRRERKEEETFCIREKERDEKKSRPLQPRWEYPSLLFVLTLNVLFRFCYDMENNMPQHYYIHSPVVSDVIDTSDH